jgi:hypothetical protein
MISLERRIETARPKRRQLFSLISKDDL